MSIIEKLTEGVINRDLSSESNALLDKWARTGLLEGIESDHGRNSMASLLENQAKELLREASTMAGGDVEGFAAVAFPIVRRVFGGLVANELVSVQPMSLPSGLIFFLDFTFTDCKLGNQACESIYGGGAVGSGITDGVTLKSTNADPNAAESSFYNLNNGYASPTASCSGAIIVVAGTYGGDNTFSWNPGGLNQDQFDRLCRYDPDFSSGSTAVTILANVDNACWLGTTREMNADDLVAVTLRASCTLDAYGNSAGCAGALDAATQGIQARRLTTYSGSDNGFWQRSDGAQTEILMFVYSDTLTEAALYLAWDTEVTGACYDFPIKDRLQAASALGAIVGAPEWGLEGLGSNDGAGEQGDCGTENRTQAIAEIDIKVDSVAITAITKKLRAKWSPELQQDINAYHNLDAEVELTSILSEQIALEIDQEILEDLRVGATAETFYWSRRPGKFVNRNTGAQLPGGNFPDFTGTVSEWYETLLETVNDVSAQIHRKTLRGGANFLVCGPEVANLLEFTNGFRANTTADENKGTAGANKHR